MRLQHLRLLALLAIGVLGFVPPATAQDAAKDQPPGAAAAIGATASATVKAIDPEKRIITLQTEDGDVMSIKCGKEVQNFDQIKVGDTVKAAAIETLAVSIGKGGSPNAEAGAMIARSPKGAKPGMVIAKTEEVTAKIDAVDPAKQTVTLTGPEGKSQTVRVSPDVDLSALKPGEDTTLRLTKGIALWVAQPREAQPAAASETPQGEPAAFAVEGASTSATVDAIDADKRLVTLKTADGATRTIHLGKECVNFNQIKVGDKVRSTLAQEVAVAVSKGGAAPSADAGAIMARAPKGGKPGLLIVDTDSVTGQIKSVDAAKGMITLAEADGDTRTFKAGPNVKLSELKAGDDVTASVTQALAIVVEKP